MGREFVPGWEILSARTGRYRVPIQNGTTRSNNLFQEEHRE